MEKMLIDLNTCDVIKTKAIITKKPKTLSKKNKKRKYQNNNQGRNNFN